MIEKEIRLDSGETGDEARRAQRRRGILARDALSPAVRAALSRQLAGHIIKSVAFEKAAVLLCYRAHRGEAQLDELCRAAAARGKTIAFPLCVSEREMIALCPEDESAWREGRFGIWEPTPERSREIAPGEIELAICPCTAFDSAGRRLGMGGGFYDRYLPRCTKAAVFAAAFEVQRVETVLSEPWDVAMDGIFTEQGFFPKNQK